MIVIAPAAPGEIPQTAVEPGREPQRLINQPIRLLAATAAVMLSVEQPQITSTWALPETIYVLMGVVLGGLNRPIPATLGGFSIGFAFGLLGGILPSNQSQYLPSFIFAAVIVVLLVRPNGLFTRGGAAVERL